MAKNFIPSEKLNRYKVSRFIKYIAIAAMLLLITQTVTAQGNAIPLYKEIPNSKPAPESYKEASKNGGIWFVSQPTL